MALCGGLHTLNRYVNEPNRRSLRSRNQKGRVSYPKSEIGLRRRRAFYQNEKAFLTLILRTNRQYEALEGEFDERTQFQR
jgi:hypothetical protein